MTNVIRLAVLTAALVLAGCTTTYVSPVEVTRFTGDQPQILGSGPIAVRAGPGVETESLELRLNAGIEKGRTNWSASETAVGLRWNP